MSGFTEQAPSWGRNQLFICVPDWEGTFLADLLVMDCLLTPALDGFISGMALVSHDVPTTDMQNTGSLSPTRATFPTTELMCFQ